MRVIRTRKSTLILLSLLMAIPVYVKSISAETRFISDMLMVNLREGQSDESKVIITLRTDTPVEVLEEGDRYVRVRTEQGEEGWIAKQYVTSRTPKPVIIAALKRDVNQLESTVEELKVKVSSLQHELQAAGQRHATRVKELEKIARETREEADRISRELKQTAEKYNILRDNSDNVVKLMGERDRFQASIDDLRASNQRLSMDMEKLHKENRSLERRARLWWFLSGSGVFLIGLILGKGSKKKKYY